MSPPTNNWRKRLIEHRFYAEIIMDITTQNSEFIKKNNRTTQKTKKISNICWKVTNL